MGRYQSLDETIDAIVYTGTFRHITGPAKSPYTDEYLQIKTST